MRKVHFRCAQLFQRARRTTRHDHGLEACNRSFRPPVSKQISRSTLVHGGASGCFNSQSGRLKNACRLSALDQCYTTTMLAVKTCLRLHVCCVEHERCATSDTHSSNVCQCDSGHAEVGLLNQWQEDDARMGRTLLKILKVPRCAGFLVFVCSCLVISGPGMGNSEEQRQRIENLSKMHQTFRREKMHQNT